MDNQMGVYKIIAKECQTKDGKKKFFAYALIHPETKKKIDFRFKLDAKNQSLIQKQGKFKVVIDKNNLSETDLYEYPRIYCDGIERLATDDDELSTTL